MAKDEKLKPEIIDHIWHTYLMTGDMPRSINPPWYHSKRLRPLFRYLPDNPRCRLCYYPFQGIGGAIMRYAFGIVPSRLNPHLCNHCEQFAEKYKGGAEVELSILFADVRGSTTLAQSMNPADFSQLINRFYNATANVLFNTNALVEKLQGDAVTGFYTPGFSGPDHARTAVDAARQILHATGHSQPAGPWIPVGIGIHTGLAYVGSVDAGSGHTDIAVLGDAANIGARLAAQAAPGQILVSQATAQAADLDPSGLEIRHETLKGRTEPTEVWVLSA